MFAAAISLLLWQYSATAQNTDSLTVQNSSGPTAVYSLQQCVDSALKNNPTVKTADFAQQTARVQYQQQIGYMLPSLSGIGQFYNSGGKSINTVTNTYINENYNQGYGVVQGGVTLWNGGSIRNYIRQYSLAYEADKKDWQYQKDLMTIQVIVAYLSVLSSEEQLSLAQQQVAANSRRVDLMTIQNNEGAISPDRLDGCEGPA